MRNFAKILIPLLVATGISGSALAADRVTETMVDRMLTEAAWDGVEVSRIGWNDKVVHAYGTDRSGRSVTIARACGTSRIVCPTVQLASKDGKPANEDGGYVGGQP